MKKRILFIASYHKGELNMIYSHMKILERMGVRVEVIYITNKGRLIDAHSHMLIQAMREDYLGFSKKIKNVEWEDLDSYIQRADPAAVSVDISANRKLTEYIYKKSIPVYERLHAFTSYPWYNQYIRYKHEVKADKSTKKLLINDTPSLKKFAWLGYNNVSVTGWTCLHSSVMKIKKKDRNSPKKLVLYSYEHREDIFPLKDWVKTHIEIIETAKKYNLSVKVRSHPSQKSSFTEIQKMTGVEITDISRISIFEASQIEALHCGVLTSGPLISHLLGRPACSLYPVRKQCYYPEHMIIPGCPIDTFMEQKMNSITYFEHINEYSIHQLFKETLKTRPRIETDKEIIERDMELETNLGKAYDLIE